MSIDHFTKREMGLIVQQVNLAMTAITVNREQTEKP
jgi:hypothetical protein